MLKILTLENFKAFGQRTEIELAPITLIFGQNSAGKSSILQSLNLLKQTYEASNKNAALLPRVDGGISDLGSFNTLLFEHDIEKTLKIGLHVSKGKTNKSLCGLEVGFRRPSVDADIRVSEMALIGDGHRYDFEVDFSDQAKSEVIATSKDTYFSEEYWKSVYEIWRDNKKFVLEQLESVRDEILMSLEHWWNEEQATKPEKYRPIRSAEEISPGLASDLIEARKAIEFYSKDFSQAQFVERFRSANGRVAVSIEQFLPEKAWNEGTCLTDYEVPNHHYYMHEDMPTLLPEPGRGAHETFGLNQLAGSVRESVEEVLVRLFPMGPVRRSPERYYVFHGTTPSTVGFQGNHLPDLLFRRPDLVERANEWLDKLRIGYRLDPRSIGDGDLDLFEFRLIDTSRKGNVAVSLSDVGYGISQILPFIVQSLASEERIISIEQPEVHIHPALQADLGTLVAEATKDPYNHQFLVETHSEHLVLRIQKLVRDGRIGADDVSVLFVSRGETGSKVERLRLDESGDFIDDWPGGFFPERLNELR